MKEKSLLFERGKSVEKYEKGNSFCFSKNREGVFRKP
jgi:hypothetical protein